MTLLLLLLGCPIITESEFAARLDADGDGFIASSFSTGDDCDDASASVHPGAAEVAYNGVDDDCDPATRDEDVDGDGFAGAPAGGSDCDDLAPGVYPGAPEVCDQVDGDCDGRIEGETDADGDGSCAMDGDCDDSDAGVHPGAAEQCDSADVDEDCDGLADDQDASPFGRVTMYEDLDGDGYGHVSVTSSRCDPAPGWAAEAGDCDDGDAEVHPDALERCNGHDDDCNELVDAADPDIDPSEGRWYLDHDGDGYGWVFEGRASCEVQAGYVHDSADCDDQDGTVSPAATEVCNGHDDNCDGQSDDADAEVDLATGTYWYVDADGDRYGDADFPDLACAPSSGFVGADSDCDDTDPAINPGAIEVCNGVEDNCDGVLLDDTEADLDVDGVRTCAGDCDDAVASTYPGAAEAWYDGVDADCDGASDYDQDADGHDAIPWGADCADSDPTANPAQTDTWYDGVDADCDGADDFDQDGDGVRADAWGGEDCDDLDPAAFGGNLETWYDGRDGDCSGGSDYDQDGDGHESDVYAGADCDDEDPALNPSVEEVASDRLDNNCDGVVDGVWDIDADVLITKAESSPLAGAAFSWAGDIDGDGGDDLLLGMQYPDENVLYVVSAATAGESSLADAITTYTHANGSESVSFTYASAFGDDDGDGTRESLIGAAGQVYLLELGGSGTIDLETAGVVVDTGTDQATFGVRVGDIDGDGLEDLAVVDMEARDDERESSFAGKLMVMVDPADRATGDASSASSAVIYWGLGHSYLSNATPAGDLNGDGFADLSMYVGNGQTYGYFLAGGGSLSGGRVYEWPDGLLIMVGDDDSESVLSVTGVGDVDGDGAADAALFNWSEWEERVLLGPVGTAIAFTDGVSPMSVGSSARLGVGDFDGDGTRDLAINQESVGSGSCIALTNPSGAGDCAEADLSVQRVIGGDPYYSDGSSGDGNGDGYSDLAMGLRDESYAAWVLYGRP